MRNRKFTPRLDSLEAKISLSTDVPVPVGPVTPGLIIPTLKPIAPPGSNPVTTNPTPLPPEAPPLPIGDYPVNPSAPIVA